MTIEQIVNAYAIAKICGIDISIAEIEKLYPQYIKEAYEEYSKLHSQDPPAKVEVLPRPF